MVRIVVRGHEQSNHVIPLSSDEQFVHFDTHFPDEIEYQGSKPMWLNIVLCEIPKNAYSELRLEVKYMENKYINKLSKVGIWTGIRDGKFNKNIGRNEYLHMTKRFSIPFRRWKFGSRASVDMNLMEELTYSDKFEFAICFRPMFYQGVSKSGQISNNEGLIKAEISNGSKDYDVEFIRDHVEKLTL